MPREPFNDLAAFVLVAEARSFTLAARGLGVSSSALSHAMRGLEARLGVRLLARTTRSVAPTEAGERLLASVRPALADIRDGLAALRDTREQPAGTVRVTAVHHAVETLLLPMLPAFTARFPDIRLEIDVDDGFTDIVADGYDAGIRFAGSVAKDMIAIRLGPELRAAIVAAPTYLADRTAPVAPKDVAEHRCIVHRRADGGVYPWPFHRNGKSTPLRVDGALSFNDSSLILQAALAGQGIACLFADKVAPFIARGRLVELMQGACGPATGYALYHAGRRQHPPALATFLEAVRAFAAGRRDHSHSIVPGGLDV